MSNRTEILIVLIALTWTAGDLLAEWSNKIRHEKTLEAIEAQPKVVQPPPKQPVYLMVRCPKGGGDVVYNITEDLTLRHLNP